VDGVDTLTRPSRVTPVGPADRRPRSARVVGTIASLCLLAAAVAALIGLLSIVAAVQAREWQLSRTGDLGPAGAVSCVTSTDCWAAGWGGAMEHLSAGVWTASSVPGAYQDVMALAGVACAATTACWAVGLEQDESGEHVLVDRYTGGGWTTAVGDGTPGQPGSGALSAITCVTRDDCWAVGDVENQSSPEFQPLVEHYSGGAWSVAGAPAPAAGGSLSAVTCAGADDCWAVGATGGLEQLGGPGSSPLIEHYAGGSWTVVSAAPPSGAAGLDAVTCAGAGGCWAAGYAGAYLSAQPLVLRYRGGAWSAVATPRISSNDGAAVTAIACQSADRCWAVLVLSVDEISMGPVPPPTLPLSASPPLLEHYAGTGWSAVASAEPLGGPGSLDAVTCLTSGTCWAVGSTASAAGFRLLAESAS